MAIVAYWAKAQLAGTWSGVVAAYRRCGLQLDLLHRSLYEPNTKNLEEVRIGSSPMRWMSRWQLKASTLETVTRSKKELPAQSLSCTQVPRTLGHALSATRSEDKGSSPVVAEVIHVICSGGWSSGPMVTKPRPKGALGNENKLCERNCQMTKQNGG
jgi:hypothetical protein